MIRVVCIPYLKKPRVSQFSVKVMYNFCHVFKNSLFKEIQKGFTFILAIISIMYKLKSSVILV